MNSSMPFVTIGYGVILTAVGIVGYFATGQVSITALIPTFLGVPVVICGVLARNERLLKHAMHGAVLFALLGLLGTLRSPTKLPALLDGTAERPAATIAQVLTLLSSSVFVALSVRSFIVARRARQNTDVSQGEMGTENKD